MEQIALIYSDGSLNVLDPKRTIDVAKAWRDSDDRNENDRAHLTKVARIKWEIVEMIDDPTVAP